MTLLYLSARAPLDLHSFPTRRSSDLGLGALIALRNLARARNGGVRLLNPTPTVQQLFDVVSAGQHTAELQTPATHEPQPTLQKEESAPASGAVVGALANHFLKPGTGF